MFESCKRQVELAEPVLRKYRVKLGIENHKGWRSAEQVAWLKQLGSEWVGVCLDFGNNLSLCEDPMDTARALVPYTCFAHIKDNAVQEYEDGFLLSEVPLGEGIIDLKQIVRMLRAVDPNMIIDLEMITRDPLKIPVFTTKYWATFDDSYSLCREEIWPRCWLWSKRILPDRRCCEPADSAARNKSNWRMNAT